MHKFFVSPENIKNNTISILGEDVEHISKVLRLRLGDKIRISDCEKNEYICSIVSIDKKSVICDIAEKLSIEQEPLIKVHLYQGMPKSTKMDLIVQKCTELGVESIIPVETQRVVVKSVGDKDISNKVTRWRRIAEEAAKQSNRGRIPDILNPVTFNEAVGSFQNYDLVVIPYENEENRGLKQILKVRNDINNVAIFIGPEGGFTDEEVKEAEGKGAFPVTLGPRILRTETAGFTCLAIIMYELGDIGGEPWQK